MTSSEVIFVVSILNLITGVITSFDDFAEYAKGFLDEDALLYAKEMLGNNANDTARLKEIAQLARDGNKKIGKKLSRRN